MIEERGELAPAIAGVCLFGTNLPLGSNGEIPGSGNRKAV